MWRLALTLGLLFLGTRLAAQEVDSNGLYSQPFLVPDPGTHTASIIAIDADDSGRYVVTASPDKSVRVWSGENGKLLRTIRLPSGPGLAGSVYALAVSPDGNTIAAGGWTVPRAFSIFFFDCFTGGQTR